MNLEPFLSICLSISTPVFIHSVFNSVSNPVFVILPLTTYHFTTLSQYGTGAWWVPGEGKGKGKREEKEAWCLVRHPSSVVLLSIHRLTDWADLSTESN